ncbi:MAG TPA: Rid family detoxifying hydrolase [Acetobacteraceae bacterium]|nr:Rid family detoxifying hydrolase [Acetobacteraceae bacterium]
MTKHVIFSDKLPKAAGPFSPAIRSQGFIYVSGQIGQDPATGKLVDGGVERQTEQALTNLVAILDAAGKGLADVVRVAVYLTDIGSFAAVNGIYARYFAEPYPARTTIGVVALPLGAVVEIDVVVKD